jgi:hypothetical protein
VCTQLSGHSDGCREEEDCVQQIQSHGYDGMAHEALVPCCGDQVEEWQHAECGYEDIVVDQRGVAGEGAGNHVADEGHNEECPQEL